MSIITVETAKAVSETTNTILAFALCRFEERRRETLADTERRS